MSEINLKDYTYDLPQDRIAIHPLKDRGGSKLLLYNKGDVQHQAFASLPDLLPHNSILYFNDTRVIPARLHFRKETGAQIEVFLLNPVEPSSLLIQVMGATQTCTWNCAIGNAKRWTDGQTLSLEAGSLKLTARLLNRNSGLVEFEWNPSQLTFSEVISEIGKTPLPPYIKREVDEQDLTRYQTIYSHYDGAVAAPTAGLHFTHDVLEQLKVRGIQSEFLTLHVSAGTFQPIKEENISNHIMHEEQVVVKKETIENLIKNSGNVIPVGTTSMRTLESLYWYGVKVIRKNGEFIPFEIDQHESYRDHGNLLSKEESLRAIVEMMTQHDMDAITGQTSIFIYPGYTFKICDGLITNFHLPGSTLILLVAALIGEDWKKVYNAALENDYRFLSYGDSSLLLPKQKNRN